MGVGNDKATRKMEAGEFRALLQQEEGRRRATRAPTIPASNELIESLVAQTATPDPDDDLAIPVEESQPPITKPPAMREVSRPPAPMARHRGVAVLLFALLAVALAEVALRMLT